MFLIDLDVFTQKVRRPSGGSIKLKSANALFSPKLPPASVKVNIKPSVEKASWLAKKIASLRRSTLIFLALRQKFQIISCWHASPHTEPLSAPITRQCE